ADMADVMVTARVHAARDVELDLTDVVQVVEIVELVLDRFGDRNALGIGQRAEIAARAADDVGQQADVGRGEPVGARLFPYGVELAELDVGQYQVLFVRDANFTKAVAIGKI